jgi:SagB-type dehydrogenase family enzyme
MNAENPISPLTPDPVLSDPVDRVINYHIQTKHHFNRYARSLGYLDWVNQPDPFRRFEGAQLISLPLLKSDEEPRSPAYDVIYQHGTVHPQPISLRTLSRFFEFALALSAWKKAGESEWALRSNPSSGNLHPTEGYIVLPRIDGFNLTPGLYHYAPKEHGLEWRAEFSADQLAPLLAPFPASAFLLGLTSIHWREAWKYGERAFRYCNHDVGHAIGSTRIAAATLGWNMTLLDGMDQSTVAMLLGTDRKEDFGEAEQEHPDCLAVVWPAGKVKCEEVEVPLLFDTAIVKELVDTTWHGRANRLSNEHEVHWDIIDDTATASWKTSHEHMSVVTPISVTSHVSPLTPHETQSAGYIIRRRRSAVAFDGKTSISSATFFHMMRRVMPWAEHPQLERPMPWDAWPYDPIIHLLIFRPSSRWAHAGIVFSRAG